MNCLNNKQEDSSVHIDDGIITCGNAIFIKEEIDSFENESKNECSGGQSNVNFEFEKSENFEVVKEEFLVSDDVMLDESNDKYEEKIDVMKKDNEEAFDEMDFTKKEIDPFYAESFEEAVAGPSGVKVASEDIDDIDVVKEEFPLFSESSSNEDFEAQDEKSKDQQPISSISEARYIDRDNQKRVYLEKGRESASTTRTVEGSFEYDDCPLRLDERITLKGLSKMQKQEKCFNCDVCSKGFNLKNNLRVHMRIHTGEKPFKCRICEKTFSRNSTLKKHFIIHTGERPFKCDVCMKAYSRKSILVNHLLTHSEERPFHCDVCQKGFCSKTSLAGHLRIHSVEKQFHCDVCHKGFNEKRGLVEHFGIHSGERPFHCGVCRKNFTRKRDLVGHLRIHSGEKAFKCDVCPKAFSRKITLMRHLRVHSGERPFHCDVCQRPFSQKSNLSKHSRTHR